MSNTNSFDFVDNKILELIRSENVGVFTRNTDSDQEFVDYPNEASLRLWFNKEQDGFPIHWHYATEIIIVLEDTYVVKTTNSRYNLSAGDILIIPAGELHELETPLAGSRVICLFDYQTLSQLNGFAALTPFLSQPVHIQRNDSSSAYNRVINLLRQIAHEYAAKNPFYELVIYARLLSLFVTIGRHSVNNADDSSLDSKQNELSKKLSIAFEYIDAHYMDNLSLDMVASVAGFSKFHFSRLFKQCSGQNFHEYLCYKRIQASEVMLLKPNISITEIAFKSGFSSLSSFNRAFRTVNNCSPTEYRMLYQNRAQ